MFRKSHACHRASEPGCGHSTLYIAQYLPRNNTCDNRSSPVTGRVSPAAGVTVESSKLVVANRGFAHTGFVVVVAGVCLWVEEGSLSFS